MHRRLSQAEAIPRSARPASAPQSHLGSGLVYQLLCVKHVDGPLVQRSKLCSQMGDDTPGGTLLPWFNLKHATGPRRVRQQTPAQGLTPVVVAVALRQYPLQERGVRAPHVWHVIQHDARVVREGIGCFKAAAQRRRQAKHSDALKLGRAAEEAGQAFRCTEARARSMDRPCCMAGLAQPRPACSPALACPPPSPHAHSLRQRRAPVHQRDALPEVDVTVCSGGRSVGVGHTVEVG